MGVDINVRLIIGVKLASYEELFYEDPVTEFGCVHRVTDTEYCPTCGSKAQYTFTRAVPLLPIEEDESDYGTKILDGKYTVIIDPERFNKDAFVCVYSKRLTCLNQGMDAPIMLTEEELADRMIVAEDMVKYLKAANVTMQNEKPAVFVVPYYS